MNTLEQIGIVYSMPEQEYHSNPALSSTGAKAILESPARFKYNQAHPMRKREFNFGSAIHSKVLGTGWDLEVKDFPDYRTKAAQEWRDGVHAVGKIPMLIKELAGVERVAEAVLAHPTARALFERESDSEVSVFAVDPDTEVSLRARFDHLPKRGEGRTIAVDLKTTSAKADPDTFARTAITYGYDVQRGHYLHTYALAENDPDAEMVFVVVETEPPHLVGVHQLDLLFADMGARKARHARELFARCEQSGVWPGYPEDVQLVTAPAWALMEAEGKYS